MFPRKKLTLEQQIVKSRKGPITLFLNNLLSNEILTKLQKMFTLPIGSKASLGVMGIGNETIVTVHSNNSLKVQSMWFDLSLTQQMVNELNVVMSKFLPSCNESICLLDMLIPHYTKEECIKSIRPGIQAKIDSTFNLTLPSDERKIVVLFARLLDEVDASRQLSAHYFYHSKAPYKHKFWLDFSRTKGLEATAGTRTFTQYMLQIAYGLNLVKYSQTTTIDEALIRIQKYFSTSNKKSLFVFYEFPYEYAFGRRIMGKLLYHIMLIPNIDVLIAMQIHRDPHGFDWEWFYGSDGRFQLIDVGLVTEQEAQAIITRYSSTSTVTQKNVRDLVSIMPNNFPLVYTLIGAYMAEHLLDVNKFIALYQQVNATVLESPSSRLLPSTVDVDIVLINIWFIIKEQLRHKCPVAITLLEYAALLSDHAIDEIILRILLIFESSLIGNTDDIYLQVKECLMSYSLIRFNEKSQMVYFEETVLSIVYHKIPEEQRYIKTAKLAFILPHIYLQQLKYCSNFAICALAIRKSTHIDGLGHSLYSHLCHNSSLVNSCYSIDVTECLRLPSHAVINSFLERKEMIQTPTGGAMLLAESIGVYTDYEEDGIYVHERLRTESLQRLFYAQTLYYGASHPELANTLNYLAMAKSRVVNYGYFYLVNRELYKDVLEDYQHALALMEYSFSSDNPALLGILKNLVFTYYVLIQHGFHLGDRLQECIERIKQIRKLYPDFFYSIRLMDNKQTQLVTGNNQVSVYTENYHESTFELSSLDAAFQRKLTCGASCDIIDTSKEISHGQWDRKVLIHPLTGAPVFRYRVYNDKNVELGSADFYQHPLLCRSEDATQHNVFNQRGVLIDTELDEVLTTIDDICLALPPTYVQQLVAASYEAAKHGSIRGVANIVQTICNPHQCDTVPNYLRNYVYYLTYFGLYFATSFAQHMHNLRMASEPDNNSSIEDIIVTATSHAIKEVGVIVAANFVINNICRAVSWAGTKTEQIGWSRSTRALQWLGMHGSAVVFGVQGYRSGVVETGLRLASGIIAEKSVTETGLRIYGRFFKAADNEVNSGHKENSGCPTYPRTMRKKHC